MTKAEQRKMDRLARENVDLRYQVVNQMRVYGDLLGEYVTLKIAMQQLIEHFDEIRGAVK